MTVRQSAQQVYRISKSTIAERTGSILGENSIYKSVYMRSDGSLFTTNVRPDFPLVLGTEMNIMLEEANEGTIVTVSTKSQALIMGDAFGMYDRYIRSFFTELQKSLGANPISVVRPHAAESRAPDINWFAVVVMILIVLYLLIFLPIHVASGLGDITLTQWSLILLFTILLAGNILRLIKSIRK